MSQSLMSQQLGGFFNYNLHSNYQISLCSMTYHHQFLSSAQYYRNYRLGYPEVLIEFIASYLALESSDVIVDLGCGTGQLAIPLSPYVGQVFAVDPEPEMLADLETQCQQQSIKNITPSNQSAEAFLASTDTLLRAAVLGKSFHWMNQEQVLKDLARVTQERGAIVLVNGKSLWNGTQDWEVFTKSIIQEFLGPERRAGSQPFKPPSKPYTQLLADSAFNDISTQIFTYPRVISLDYLIGYLYSTSFASSHLFGDRVQEFEETLRSRFSEKFGTTVVEEIKIEVMIGEKAKTF